MKDRHLVKAGVKVNIRCGSSGPPGPTNITFLRDLNPCGWQKTNAQILQLTLSVTRIIQNKGINLLAPEFGIQILAQPVSKL